MLVAAQVVPARGKRQARSAMSARSVRSTHYLLIRPFQVTPIPFTNGSNHASHFFRFINSRRVFGP